MNNDVYAALGQIVSKQDIYKNELMSRHTTFRTGGPASLFLRPRTTEEIKGVIKLLKRAEVDFFILGNGSNLLVSDKGYDGVVISLSNFSDIKIEDETQVNAQAGAMNSAIASLARDNALAGFEFAAGIPGTIGGAMIMNAGAYGGEMKDITRQVQVLTPDGDIIKLDNNAMKFGYRTSAIKGKNFVVLSALLDLKKGNKDEISAQMQDLALRRKEKQPLEYPSAGSTFKRPEGYFAGKLIEDAGLRGFSVGDAAVSEKHCGFVINKGNATSTDIYELIKRVQDKVYENAGVKLEPEVIMLGKFD